MFEIMPEEENDRESHRSLILALAGFSFSGLLAFIVLDGTLRQDFHLTVFFLLLSFLSYFLALNLQGYKSRRWHDQLGNALMDSASLSLILAIISVFLAFQINSVFYVILAFGAFSIWALDHIIKLKILSKFLRTKDQ